MAAFADQMAAMDAEFWRIAQNPGSMLGANESPYYSLYMKQYQQRARDRETNAYTRATAGTGGYGSSYASLVSEVARRRVMEGMSEQEATLYKAAREAFLSERASAVEWYERAKALYGDAVDIADYEWMQAMLQKEEGA